jgi:glycosyltransferase involved in cell wall biosynthesis
VIELSVVSGTFNRFEMLKRMIYSVRSSAAGISYEIILIDGGSTDGTLEWARQQTDIRLIEHAALYGAIKAYNDGAALAQGEYVVFSNDDLSFDKDALPIALAYMYDHPETGIGLFQTNRSHHAWHVAEMPAHYPGGRMTNAPYGGIMIMPRALGDKLQWWHLPGARTYGGDNALCSRAIEAGWPVIELVGARVDEPRIDDELKRVNTVPTNDNHPDTAAYLRVFPHGPELGHVRTDSVPLMAQRILYAPIYEEGHKVQHIQKRGLRRALQRIGVVREIDYITDPDAILRCAEQFKPDLIVTQLHYSNPFTPAHSAKLRELLPTATLVNWNGDVYDRSNDAGYIQTLKPFDLQTTVNASAIAGYETHGIRTAYWQVGYEPDGIGYESDESTPRHDVIFLGNGYRVERHIFGSYILSLPCSTAIYGDFWPDGWAKPSTLYDFRYGCQLYRNAKIALGDSDWSAEGGKGFVSNRPFQAMAAGGCLMLQKWFDGCEEYLNLVDGKHLVLWHDHDDLHKKVIYYLNHEDERQMIVRAGQLEVLRHHSFDARVQQLLGILAHLDNRIPGIKPELIGPEYA